MSEQDIKSVSTLTGSFAALKTALEQDAPGGKQGLGTGNKLPDSRQPDANTLARELNVVSQSIGRDLRFEVDVRTGSSVIQVLDRETGEIIRQIPPENAKTYVSERGDVTLRLYDDRV